MTKLLPLTGTDHTSGNISPSVAGAAPNGSSMQGNPDAATRAQDQGRYPPGPQCGGTGQNQSSQNMPSLLSHGNIPTNTQPSNLVNAAPGTTSILALISSGQVSMNQSTYGQGATITPDSGPQVHNSSNPQSQPTGSGSAMTTYTPPIYTGD
jgi:hypothetical protein